MRHAIEGLRPGTTIHVGGRFVATNESDGGARLTDADREELIERGHVLREVEEFEETPDPSRPTFSDIAEGKAHAEGAAEAAQRIAEQKVDAEKLAASATTAPKKK